MANQVLERLHKEGKIAAEDVAAYTFGGELNDRGMVLGIRALLPMAIAARKEGKKGIFVHPDQVEEAAIVNDIDVLPVSTVDDVLRYFLDKSSIQPVLRNTRDLFASAQESPPNDMADIIEDENAKHALEIAAIGSHHVFLYGDVRSGKNRLVEHLPGILPKLSLQEALEITRRFSNEGAMKKGMGLMAHRPILKMGPYTDINLARKLIYMSHLGILWLQDISEMKQGIQELVAETLQSGRIYHWEHVPVCKPTVVATASRPEFSEHLEPFFDIFIDVPIIEAEDHLRFGELETSLEIRERVEDAFNLQNERYKEAHQLQMNRELRGEQTKDWVKLDQQTQVLLKISLQKQGISPKKIPQILRVSRSIADRVGEEQPLLYHVAEAVQYLNV